MVNLAQADKLAIVRWLSELPEFESESGRRRLLGLAGLGSVVSHIDVSGAPFLAAASVVDFLGNYGRPTPDAEALGMLLNLALSLVGKERGSEIAEMIRRYAMLTPIAISPALSTIDHGFASPVLTEKIIGQNTLKSIAFLARGLAAAQAVALVSVLHPDNAWLGSGFLVGPDLFLTNHHVVGTEADAAATELKFDFEEDEYGRAKKAVSFSVDGILAADKTLDYSLLRVHGRPGDDRGSLRLRGQPIRVGDRVNIIQHPAGQLKQISFQHNLVEYIGGNVVQYVTSTLPGSSGSPVLDDDWKLVAIHHAGGMLSEPTTGASYYRNEGIAISAITAHLPDEWAIRVQGV